MLEYDDQVSKVHIGVFRGQRVNENTWISIIKHLFKIVQNLISRDIG